MDRARETSAGRAATWPCGIEPRRAPRNRPTHATLCFAALLLGLVGLWSAPPSNAQANVQGTWQTLPITSPINPVHAALMHNGKILIVSGSGNYPPQTDFNANVFDPVAVSLSPTQSLTWDMFCNGMVVLPDGRPFIMGGNLQYDPFHGWKRTAAYDPATGKFIDMEDMAHGRWYPTSTVLGDGRVMVFSGLDENGGTNTQVEVYKVGVGFGAPHSAPWTPPLYPRMHLLTNGKVFYSGSTTQSRTFDPSNNTWSGVIATTNYGGDRTYGSSVLLPLTPANAYKPRVMIFGGGNPSTATTEIIDMSAATPAWVTGPPMSQPRIEMNATLLPNGKVLAVGGSLNDEDTNTASLQADLYDSNNNTMGSAGANAVPRLYHSVSLLLPDATVWIAGGNPQRGTFEPSMEIYTPPYLFNPDGSAATRPAITSLSNNVIGYGGTFTVNTPDAANIASVVLMRNGSVTHAFDMDQRMVGLSFTAGAGSLTVTGPPNGNIAQPGYYMLFILNNAGVPSVAPFVQISTAPTDVPPTGAITNPATDTSITPGSNITFTASGTAPSGSIASYSWSIRGASPATSSAQNPTITFSTPGIYTAVLTVTDSAAITDPSPETRTITVSNDPAPTVTSVAPPTGIQGQTALAVTVTGTNFLANPTCSFGVGIDINSCTFVNSTTIAANLDILANSALGSRDVTITNSDGQIATLPAGFSVTGGVALPAPTLNNVIPNSEFQGATNVTVTLTGTNFQPGVTCYFDVDFGGTVNTCSFVSATQINLNLTISQTAVLGGHNVVVQNPDGQSAEVINGFTVTQDLGNTVKLGSGFTVGAMVLNGNAQLNGNILELTDGNFTETSSAWYATRVNVQNFVTDFTFQLTPGTTADGFTFALQGESTASLGTAGGALGWGTDVGSIVGGIPNSVAVKFDLFDNDGEGPNSTGIYVSGVNGIPPTTPAVDLTPSGIDLHSGDTFAVHMTYDGANLAMTITDTTTNAVFTQSWPVDIPTVIGANTAYAGFTGGTGGLVAVQNILTWTLGPLSPAVTFSPTGPINFPDTPKNSTSAPITVTVKNTGSAALHISTVTFTGTNLTDFGAATNTCNGATVAVNATCTVGVTFTPTGTGPRTANLSVADDAAGSPHVLAVEGVGTAASGPDVTVTPAGTILFANTAQNQTSAPVQITVTNSGNAALNVTGLTFAGTNPGDFAVATGGNGCTAAVAPSASCLISLTFTPTAVGARTATLQIADNATGSPQSVPLSGTGTSSNPNGPAFTATPNPFTLSATQGTTSAASNLTITNTGTSAMHITNVTFGGANVSEFVNPTTTPGACVTLAANASCNIAISFAPLTTGNHTETVTVTDDAPGSPHAVTVTGNASVAAFSGPAIGSASLTATVNAGQTAQYTVPITPGAGYSGSVTFTCSGNPSTTTCTVNNPVTLTAGTAANLTVSISTTARGSVMPMGNRQPRTPTNPLLFVALAACLALLAAMQQLKRRGILTNSQAAYSASILILVLAVCGIAGCASDGNGGGSNPPPATGTQAGTYTITLTPSAMSTSGQAITVTPIQLKLIVN